MDDKQKVADFFIQAAASALASSPSLSRAVSTAIVSDPQLLKEAVSKLTPEIMAEALAEKIMIIGTLSSPKYREGAGVYIKLSNEARRRAVEIAAEAMAAQMANDVRTA